MSRNARVEPETPHERKVRSQVGPDLAPALDDDRIWRAIARVVWTGNPPLDRSSLDALVESGGIQLLDDVEGRTQLIRWLQRREQIATLTEFNTIATDDLNEYLTTAGAFAMIADALT